MRTTVHLPDALLKRAKQVAAKENRTLTSMIEEGLRIVLANRAPSGEIKPRTLPRCSKATGGLRPGLDPIKLLQQIEEIDDAEMIARTSGVGGTNK